MRRFGFACFVLMGVAITSSGWAGDPATGQACGGAGIVMNEDRNQELETKRQELEQLRRRVAELEKELNGEAPSQFQIEFLMAEVSLTKLRELGFDWHTLVDGIEKQVEGKNEDVFRANESLPTQTFKAIVKAFRTKGLLKVLAQPTIVTTAGRPASVRSGGEFPIPMPGAGKQLSLQWRQFGVTAETVVTPLDNDQVRLDFSVECAERDMSKTAQFNGLVIPGVTVRGINTQATVKLDQTFIGSAFVTKSDEDEQIMWVVAVTPSAIQDNPKRTETSSRDSFLPLGDVVVNLNEGRMNRYLRVRPVLQVAAGDAEKVRTTLASQAPAVKNWLVGHLSDKTLDDLRGKPSQDELRLEVRDGLNAALFDGQTQPIVDVLFEEFNVQ